MLKYAPFAFATIKMIAGVTILTRNYRYPEKDADVYFFLRNSFKSKSF